MSTTDVTSMTNAVVVQVRTKLLEVLRAKLVAAPYGERMSIDKGHSTLRALQVPDLSASTTTLADDGANPTAEALTLSTFTITPSEIGRLVSVTRRALNVVPIELVGRAANILAFDASRRIDTISWNALIASGTARFSGTASVRTSVAANITTADVRKWGTKLRSLNAMGWDGADSFVALTHPFVIGDLMADTTTGSWLDTSKYSASTQIFNAEAGKLFGSRFVESTNASVAAAGGAGSADVYISAILGREAFGIGDIESVRTTYVPADSTDHADALGRTALIGYYMDLGATAFNANNYVRFESAATAL